MKIVLLDGYTANPGDISWDEFQTLGDFTSYDFTEPELTMERIGDAQIVMTNKVEITREIIEKSKIRYIGVIATGYNVVDIEAAKEYGIIVTNIPDYSSDVVAQWVFALLLELTSKVSLHNDAVHAGEWSESRDFCFWKAPLGELLDKTIGIIGYGKIGKNVGKIAEAFGMKIAYVTSKEGNIDKLLSTSDVISLNCPLTESNAEIISKETINKMKDGVLIINAARGGLVNEQDLADALKSGKVAAAGLDVLSAEPPEPDNPLLAAPNCVITPHIAWAAKETRERLLHIAAENIKAFFEGNAVNVI